MRYYQAESKILFIFTPIFAATLIVSIYLLRAESKFKCSDQQLHQVIELVEKCNKERVICSEKIKTQIIKDICR